MAKNFGFIPVSSCIKKVQNNFFDLASILRIFHDLYMYNPG